MEELRGYRKTQIITKGTIDMVPKPLTIRQLMEWEMPKTKPSKPRLHKSYRSRTTGDGVCSKCLKKTKNEDFASRRGYICKSCKTPKTRGADKNKRKSH